MPSQSLRSVLIVRGIVAHFVGLGAASFWVAVQIDSFPVLGTTVEGMILGAILASPWATAMLGIFWFAATWLDRHVGTVCLLGPMLVWASAYALVASGHWLPEKYMEPVMVASVVASAVYFAMHVLRQRRIADT